MARAAITSQSDLDAPAQESQHLQISRFRKILAALMLPREHGAWAMLLMPYLVGTAAGGAGWPSLLLLASVLLLFSSSRPLELFLQGLPSRVGVGVRPAPRAAGLDRQRRRAILLRLSAYLGLGGTAGLLLLLLYHRWALLAIGSVAGLALAAQLPLRRRRLDRGWPARLLSIAALSATGPAAYYTASGLLDRHAAAVWLITLIYSGTSIFYVRLLHPPTARMKQSGTAEESRTRAGRQLRAYLAVAAVAAAALAVLGWLPPWAFLAYAPTVVKVAWAWARPDYRPTLRQIGFAEIGHTALFALLAVVAVSSWG